MKCCLVLACWLMLSNCLTAVTITDFGFVVGKVTLKDPIHLHYDDIKSTNPPLPVIYAPVDLDTSSWHMSGDPVGLSTVTVTGFDSPTMSIKLDADCKMFQIAPSGIINCDVTSIVHTDSPALFGTPITVDSDQLFITQNGAFADSAGFAHVPLAATASGTGAHTFLVSEVNFGWMLMAGSLLLGVGLLRTCTAT